jgi:hypothetical protein
MALRRATTTETGLADHLHGYRQTLQLATNSRDMVHAEFGSPDPGSCDVPQNPMNKIRAPATSVMQSDGPAVELARSFLRLANLPNFALDRLSRYEAALWRQVAQLLFSLDALDRRKPQERTRRFSTGGAISSIPDDEA